VAVAQFIGESGHCGAIAHVEHMCVDVRDRRTDPRCSVVETLGAAASEVDAIARRQALRQTLGKGKSETLISAANDCDSSHPSILPLRDRRAPTSTPGGGAWASRSFVTINITAGVPGTPQNPIRKPRMLRTSRSP